MKLVGDSGTICFYCNNFTFVHQGRICGDQSCLFNRAECLGLQHKPCEIFCSNCLSSVDGLAATSTTKEITKRKMLDIVRWKTWPVPLKKGRDF